MNERPDCGGRVYRDCVGRTDEDQHKDGGHTGYQRNAEDGARAAEEAGLDPFIKDRALHVHGRENEEREKHRNEPTLN